VCAQTVALIRHLGAREKMRLAKFILRLGKFIFSRSKMGKCKPQKIFSKPHFFGSKVEGQRVTIQRFFFSSNAETQRRKDFFFRV